jgi:hypothetical protein
MKTFAGDNVGINFHRCFFERLHQSSLQRVWSQIRIERIGIVEYWSDAETQKPILRYSITLFE